MKVRDNLFEFCSVCDYGKNRVVIGTEATIESATPNSQPIDVFDRELK